MSYGTRVELPPKRQGEVISPPFDFSFKCQAGDILSAPVVTCTVWSGVDASPSSVLTGTNPITGQVVNVGLQAGVVGVIYIVKCSVTASLSGTLILEGMLAVLPEGM